MKCDHQLPLSRRIQVCDLFVLSQPDVVNRFCVTGKNKINKKKKDKFRISLSFSVFFKKNERNRGKMYTPNTHT